MTDRLYDLNGRAKTRIERQIEILHIKTYFQLTRPSLGIFKGGHVYSVIFRLLLVMSVCISNPVNSNIFRFRATFLPSPSFASPQFVRCNPLPPSPSHLLLANPFLRPI